MRNVNRLALSVSIVLACLLAIIAWRLQILHDRRGSTP
jgi:hypothetical protein